MARERRPWPEWTALALVAGVLLLALAVFLTFVADWYDSGSVWAYGDQERLYPPWAPEAIAANDRALRRALKVGIVGIAVTGAPFLARRVPRARRGDDPS